MRETNDGDDVGGRVAFDDGDDVGLVAKQWESSTVVEPVLQ